MRLLPVTRYLAHRSNINLYDNYQFQYQQGFLTDDAREVFQVRLKSIHSSDLSAAFYSDETLDFRSSFREAGRNIGANHEPSF